MFRCNSRGSQKIEPKMYKVRAVVKNKTLTPANSCGDAYKRKIFDWCSTANPYSKHRSAKNLRHPNTVLWFFDSPEYQKWVEKPNSAIWLYGIREWPDINFSTTSRRSSQN